MTKYAVGEIVESVGGFFKHGIVLKVDKDILTIRWTQDVRNGITRDIDFVQEISADIVKLINRV